MAARRVHDLIAWQRAEDFRREVYRLVGRSVCATADLRYRGQVLGAAGAVSKDIAEGFLRYSPSAFIQFLDYGLGSLIEAEQHLTDGIERGYLARHDCQEAFAQARRCLTAMVRLKQSQQRFLKAKAGRRRSASDRW